MKIGILSMQRVYNYGSFLQAYSLKKVIESLGHQCEFIDIEQGRILDCYKVAEIQKRKSYASKIDKYILKRIEHVVFKKKRSKLFEEKLFSQLGLNKKEIDKFDVVVIGSDEVFNCTQNAEWGFSTQLLGKGINSKKVITYAASCGFTTLEKLSELGLTEEVIECLSNISEFSVRDKNTYNFVEALTDKKPIMSLDPVLIGDFKGEITNELKEEDYIVIYGYDNRINDEKEIETIKKFAKKNKLKTVGVGFYQRWCDKNVLVEPFELLEYFQKAKFIITDTFHGTIFSIKLNKPFATIIRDSNREKLFYLLERFGFEAREVTNINKLEEVLTSNINFTKSNLIIEEETLKSHEYLKNSLRLQSNE